MKKYIGFLLGVTYLIFSIAGPSLAQPGTAVDSEEESSLPAGTLLEHSPVDNFPASDYPDARLEQGDPFVVPESTKGFDEQKVLQDPLCDPTHRPTIQTITPDEAKPGDTIRVTGNYLVPKSGVSTASPSENTRAKISCSWRTMFLR